MRAAPVLGLRLWIALLGLLAACTAVEPQGKMMGAFLFNGVRYDVSGDVRQATVHGGDAPFFALEIIDNQVDTGARPAFGDLCLWMDGALETGVAIPTDGIWPERTPPFTEEQWFCQPPSGQTGPFLGLRCEAPTPGESTPTPNLEPEAPTPTPEATPTPPIPHFAAESGMIEVVAGAAAACDRVELRFTDVDMRSTGCGGAFDSLVIESLDVSATVLGSGRDWATGGYSACDGL